VEVEVEQPVIKVQVVVELEDREVLFQVHHVMQEHFLLRLKHIQLL
jgi:hypothetical protein